ncbi:MAG: LysR family transcriptional regulator [Bacilli bacterium]
MEIRDLEIFYTVARTGSMTKAAGELGFVQSHITGRIRLLEKELNHTLFERIKTGVLLTADGQRLYPHVESLLAEWNRTRAVLLESGAPIGALRIGSLETTAALHVAGWLSKYHNAYPQVEISLETGTTKDLLQGVLNRKLDVAFVAGTVVHPDLAAKALLAEEPQIITPAGWSPDDLLRKNPVVIAFREGCTYRRILERWILDREFTVLQTMECASIDTILQLVAGGLGISLMPKAVIEQSKWARQLATHSLKGNREFITTYAAWRGGAHLASSLSALLAQLPELRDKSDNIRPVALA